MSDLAKRLRDHEVSPFHGGCADCYGTIMDDAADEIERLRAALKRIADRDFPDDLANDPAILAGEAWRALEDGKGEREMKA